MQTTVQQGAPLDTATPLLALVCWQDEALPAAIADLIEATDFQGKPGQASLLYPRAALPARRLLLLGLGERSQATADRLREAAARAAQRAQALQLSEFALAVPDVAGLPAAESARALVEGTLLGSYRYLDYKTELSAEQTHRISRLTLVSDSIESAESLSQGITQGTAIAQGTLLARTLANAPGNQLTPSRMAATAQEIGSRLGMRVTVLDEAALQEQGFGGILAVSQGSAQPPRFIIMEHGSPTPDQPTICLVGKGITFDTGGISIKPAANMDVMKMDMGGAAAVLGTMQALGELQLPLHVVALISAAENMPGARAYKPGDIITTLSGKTVEVLNTDAEGRIVLADALFYAQRYQPGAVIDLATLTGAVVVALGPHAMGCMGTSQPLIDRLIAAGTASGERVWQLPLWDDYREMLKSDVADVKNVAGRAAGSIIGAAFLDHFVGDYPWAHLDLAGTAWVDKPERAYQTSGATGIGVRMLMQLLTTWSGPLHADRAG
jgi:leucyl aminopeptidase